MEHFNLRAWKARDRENLLCSETDILSVTETDIFYEWLKKIPKRLSNKEKYHRFIFLLPNI